MKVASGNCTVKRYWLNANMFSLFLFAAEYTFVTEHNFIYLSKYTFYDNVCRYIYVFIIEKGK